MLRSQNKVHGIVDCIKIVLRNAVQKEKACKKFRVDEIKIKNHEHFGFRFSVIDEMLPQVVVVYFVADGENIALSLQNYFSFFLSKKYFLQLTAKSEPDVRFDIFGWRTQTLISCLFQQ